MKTVILNEFLSTRTKEIAQSFEQKQIFIRGMIFIIGIRYAINRLELVPLSDKVERKYQVGPLFRIYLIDLFKMGLIRLLNAVFSYCTQNTNL